MQPDGPLTPQRAGYPLQRLRFGANVAMVPVPFSSPSLLDLDGRVHGILERALSVRGLKPTTVRWARQSFALLRCFVREAKSERAFLSGDVRQQLMVLQEWVGWMRRRGVQSVAVNSAWRGAASVFRWMSEEDGMLSPFAFIEAPRFAKLTPSFLPKARAEELLRTVRNARWRTPLARTRNLAIVALMLLAGLRRSEVLRLAVADVDLQTREIKIRGGKGMFGGKDRTSWMAPQLVDILGAYLRERGRATPERTHPELVTHLHANHGVSVGTTQHLFRRISGMLDARVTPHMLRHTYATLLRQAGVPDRLSMELLGHSSLSMLQHYSHVESGESAAAARLLQLNVEL